MKFKDFQAPVLFSRTFKALNLGEKNSRTSKDAWEPCKKPTPGIDTEEITVVRSSMQNERQLNSIEGIKR